MEKYILTEDVKVFYVTAKSFPAGILTTLQKVHSLISDSFSRTTFGISHADKKGNIIYKAAVEESFESEGEKFGCERFVIKKGEHISITLKDLGKISQALAKHLRNCFQIS